MTNIICAFTWNILSSTILFIPLILGYSNVFLWMYSLSSLYTIMSNNLNTDTQMFSCGVCFDEYPLAEKILCGFEECEAERHSFCQKCVVSHAKASTEEIQLAEGGFRCMEHGCTNSILYSVAIQQLLPQNVKERLDERIMEEDLAKSGLILERCRDCNYAMEMEQSKEENMIFPCLKCRKKWCRICGREWNHEHQNVTCSQLDARKNIDKKKRELECKLNEAIIRKCECGLHFTKDEGCNKMTCRCGLTQCYLCREKNIDYNHFCQHVREPGITTCPCGKKCTIWIDANTIDQVVIDRIYAEAAKEGVNFNNGVKQNPLQKNGEQEEQPAARRLQRNPDAMRIDLYANQQIRNVAQQREQYVHQMALQMQQAALQMQQAAQQVQQIVQQRQHAFDQAAHQRQLAVHQLQAAARQRQVAAQQRQHALRQAAHQRQLAAHQRQLAAHQRQLAAQQRQHALRQAAHQRQLAAQQRQRVLDLATHQREHFG